MREILYRGKRKDNGEWVYGYYCKCGWTGKEKDVIIPSHASSLYGIDVIPETVGQYTGLTDKNGKKIFEGDIIRAFTVDDSEERRAIVGFDRFFDENTECEYIGFYIYFLGVKTTVTQLDYEQAKESLEVIGNIHDNPELMETQDLPLQAESKGKTELKGAENERDSISRETKR
jgi:uncharacterized phage protein (TIGR01671 family)